MIFGEERLFIIECPEIPSGMNEFILKCIGEDLDGFKMKGVFPKSWTTEMEKTTGPLLFDEDDIYEVVKTDYENNILWLRHVLIQS